MRPIGIIRPVAARINILTPAASRLTNGLRLERSAWRHLVGHNPRHFAKKRGNGRHGEEAYRAGPWKETAVAINRIPMNH